MHKEKIDKFDYNPPPQICTWQKLLNQSGGKKKKEKGQTGQYIWCYDNRQKIISLIYTEVFFLSFFFPGTGKPALKECIVPASGRLRRWKRILLCQKSGYENERWVRRAWKERNMFRQ